MGIKIEEIEKGKVCKHCSLKKHPNTEEFKKKLINRLNRIEGQIRGISKMVNDDIYCDEVINQISSVKSALNGVSKVLLESLIKSCVVDQIKEGKDDVIDELLATISRMAK